MKKPRDRGNSLLFVLPGNNVHGWTFEAANISCCMCTMYIHIYRNVFISHSAFGFLSLRSNHVFVLLNLQAPYLYAFRLGCAPMLSTAPLQPLAVRTPMHWASKYANVYHSRKLLYPHVSNKHSPSWIPTRKSPQCPARCHVLNKPQQALFLCLFLSISMFTCLDVCKLIVNHFGATLFPQSRSVGSVEGFEQRTIDTSVLQNPDQ